MRDEESEKIRAQARLELMDEARVDVEQQVKAELSESFANLDEIRERIRSEETLKLQSQFDDVAQRQADLEQQRALLAVEEAARERARWGAQLQAESGESP